MRDIDVQDWDNMMKVIKELIKAINNQTDAINRSTNFR
jgi:hypothetical protein